jgi:hypothetical protein
MMTKKKVYINSTGIVNLTCGVSYLGYFRHYSNHEPHWGDPPNPTIANLQVPQGAGWFIAGFTNEKPVYAEAYEQLKAKYKIVYQSPVRVNTRTGRQFFFCIYDAKSKP